MNTPTAAWPHPTLRAAMDRAVDEHFRHEAHDDVDAVLATLSDDVDHDVVGSPTGPLRGRLAARGFYERIFTDLAQARVRTLRRYHGPDFVVDESLWTGTAVGDPLGFPGRHRPLEFRILHLFEFTADGRIRRENVWMDTMAIAAQLQPEGPPPSPAPQPGARAVVTAFYEAFDQGRLGEYPAIDPAFEARVFGDTRLDWPGFVAFGAAFREAFPGGRHVFEQVVTEGDCVSTVGRYRGRHERGFMGVPATGREVDFVVFHLDRVRDGRIVEHKGIGDAATMWRQLGVAPPEPR